MSDAIGCVGGVTRSNFRRTVDVATVSHLWSSTATCIIMRLQAPRNSFLHSVASPFHSFGTAFKRPVLRYPYKQRWAAGMRSHAWFGRDLLYLFDLSLSGGAEHDEMEPAACVPVLTPVGCLMRAVSPTGRMYRTKTIDLRLSRA